MAKLKATTYQELEKLFGDKEGSLKIGNNTTAKRNFDTRGRNCYEIILHTSVICVIYADSMMFNLNHWNTVTTRERINQFLPPDYLLFNKNHVAHLSGPKEKIEVEDYGWYVIGNVIRKGTVVYSTA